MADSIFRVLVSPGFRTGVYAGNAIWHSMAFLNFSFRPEFMMKKLTIKDSTKLKDTSNGDEYAKDIMRYLGGINGGYAILAFLRFIPLAYSLTKSNSSSSSTSPSIKFQQIDQKNANSTIDILCLTALGLANLSQAYLNFFYSKQTGRWIVGHWRGLKTDRITILDSLFTILDFSIVGARLAGF